MGLLRLDAVSKSYRTRQVLREVDLDVAPGEITAVTGGNGSGKSTLLRIIAGVSQPSSGTVTERPAVVGYVPERFPPQDRLTARAYLTHLGRIRGLTTSQAERRGMQLLDRLALAGGPDTAVRKLSKGNAQKVALAQALLVPPRLLVLDEPWSGLDASAHDVLSAIIAEVADTGGAVVFTDHREAVTRANSTRVYRIDAGQLSALEAAPVPAQTLGAAESFVIVLRPAPGGAPPADLRWAEFEGVRRAEFSASGVSLDVDARYSDRLVVYALQNGWSLAAAHGQAAAAAPNGPRPVAQRLAP